MTRNGRPLARPKKQHEGGEEDEPTYLNEDGHSTLSKSQFEALMSGEPLQVEDRSAQPADTKNSMEAESRAAPDTKKIINEDQKQVEKTAEIGSSTKRRLAKVIGEDTEENKEEKLTSSTPGNDKKLSKKRKKMKLSFDEE